MKKHINRSLIISLVALGAAITLLVAVRSIYSGVAGAQTPTTTEAAQNSQVARRVNGEVYYDIKFSTDQVSRGKEKRFNITVTAINNETGQIDKNPFQRVELTALPIKISNGGTKEVEQTFPGTFTDEVGGTKSLSHAGGAAFSPYDDITVPSEIWPVDSFDLINGTGEVSFSLTNTPTDDDYIGFMAVPTTWYIPPGYFSTSKGDLSANAHRLSLQIPRQPANHNFLYKEWQTDDAMASHVFTIATLPVGDAIHQTMIELGNWEPKSKPLIDQPQNEEAQNTMMPPAANLTQPEYKDTSAATSRLHFWLWLIGSLISLIVISLSYLSLKKRSRKAK